MIERAKRIPVLSNIEEEQIPGNFMCLFPGQGVQEVGMGKILYDSSEIARGILDQLPPELLYIMFNGPRDALNDTANAQPAIVAVSLAKYFEYRKVNPSWQPFAFLGHSTGQISALAAAGVVGIGTALRIAAKRGELMKAVGEKIENKGGMLAIGTTLDKAELLCLRANTSEALGGKKGVWIANDNSPDQVVLSGRENHIVYVEAQAKEAGIKKMKRISVFIAAHCPLMQEAQDRLAQYLDPIKFETPPFPIFLNTTTKATIDPEEIKADLINGLTTGVKFRGALKEAQKSGATSFVEIGKGPLRSFVQKVIPDSIVIQRAT